MKRGVLRWPFFETNQELECQSFQWVDQAQREKINLCGELQFKKTDFSEKVEQEIANKLKNYEESVAMKQIEQDNSEFS